MKWGSSAPGAIFTGAKRWQAEIDAEHFVLRIDGEPEVAGHLVQLRVVHVSTGLMWASCSFEVCEGDATVSRSVDGIPNDQAKAMRREINVATTTAIAEFVAQNAKALDAWIDRAMAKLKLKADVIARQAEIERVMSTVPGPITPGQISWSAIFGHIHAGPARQLGKQWPAWSGLPTDELRRRVHDHNARVFQGVFNRWRDSATAMLDANRWIPKSMATKVVSQCPAPEWPDQTWTQAAGDASPAATMGEVIDAKNAEYLERQRQARRPFFNTVEKNPLTEEQIHACICMDDSVMLVAAAGSGKTSTMVAKTGYVLHEGLATPDQILLLAFNRATARELTERIATQLRGVPNVSRVRSSTFHAFGIDVIAKATGRAPSLARCVDPDTPGADIGEIADIIKTLSEKSAEFKREWDLFRTIYARDLGKWGQPQEPDAYREGRRGFLTANGEIVKSKQERAIADWLFYNGVTYEYERPYEYDTADQNHRQYFPDFYYPDAKLYHEHFALNALGEPPESFDGYLSGVQWKRCIHAEKSTDFIETTSHSLMTGEGLKTLHDALVHRGVRLDFNPDRPHVGLKPVPERELARTFRVFQQHVKNNGLTLRQLQSRLTVQSEDGYAARLHKFLWLYERIAKAWERRLKEHKCIDFEDMLIQAAELVESGMYQSPYTVILADEFQDCSRARVRLLKALAKNPKVQTHLCVVGDDWQGINRFAGSDISVMTEFEKTFEHATRLTLNTTFRCPQALCDVSSKFILANPAQIAKTVKTTNPLSKTPLLAFGFQRKESIPDYVATQLELLHGAVSEGRCRPTMGTQVTVMLLGRYRNDKPDALDQWQRRFGDRLRIEYLTVHGSKGLEAEYVFVLNVLQGTHGFPSEIQDDPALQLAMPVPDPFPNAEERRLFYVAMTRARKQVWFFTTLGQPSAFLLELVNAGYLTIQPVDGDPLEPCPQCGFGVLQVRSGPRGALHGCSRFPACDFTRDLHSNRERTPSPRRSQRIRKAVEVGQACPICRKGVLQERHGKHGPFLGCSRYREGCKATANIG